MIEHGLTITETEWIMYVVIDKGVILDDSNFLQKIEFVINKCKEKNKTRLLVDTSAAIRKVSVMKLFDGTKLLQKLGVVGFKIAIISPQLAEHEDSKFVENVANFSIHIPLQYFKNKDKALEWLLK